MKKDNIFKHGEALKLKNKNNPWFKMG